ncbi:hypothetical protein [Paenibacillus sp. DMB5]|uniref:hypothetical protein n=1 Tax=Paenibacillus sp. DMB5 TaxID=1780103 RepID=UPI00076D0763|nr:hypothetical protein [Paenibacillus sp. DMB5]KUP24593.1 hypothetical protein AWJ19_19910 [Paenibacillus sp. DMB5]
MPKYYLDNIFTGRSYGMDFLLSVVYGFLEEGDKLYFEYGYSYINSFPYKNVENFEDSVNRIWYRPKDKEEAKSIIGNNFMINCIVLERDRDMESCKYRLLVVESMESIELMVTEYEEGSFQKLLKTKLKPFLEQGVKVLID